VHLDPILEADIPDLHIPMGFPIHYHLEEKLRVVGPQYFKPGRF
jgi:bisphosphoglycerate-dependent phosphoglycerate mutase